MARTFSGIITSIAMNNTAVVEVFRKVPHPLYRKLLTRSKKYKVETSGQDLAKGDTVKISETKPMSKGKYFKITDIVAKVKEAKHA